jgi:hypothetical protein
MAVEKSRNCAQLERIWNTGFLLSNRMQIAVSQVADKPTDSVVYHFPVYSGGTQVIEPSRIIEWPVFVARGLGTNPWAASLKSAAQQIMP